MLVIGGLSAIIRVLRDAFVADIAKHVTPLLPSRLSNPVLARSLSEALIGLSPSELDAKGTADANVTALMSRRVPCWPELTEHERVHEEAFVALLERSLRAAVHVFGRVSSSVSAPYSTFEVDAAKRLYLSYGQGRAPSGKIEHDTRAMANHALHPLATLVARLAFLQTLDDLGTGAASADEIFVTSGGCAAGKGSLVELVKASMGGALRVSAVWDAAGEGDAEENAWLLEAAQARKLRILYGYVANDPRQTYAGVLDRALVTGRIVDPITFARSYTRGHANMRAFLASPAYTAAERAGEAAALGLHAGTWDPATATYPAARPIGKTMTLSASDLDGVAVESEATVIGAAVATLEKWLESRRKHGSVERWLKGAVINTFKFENLS